MNSLDDIVKSDLVCPYCHSHLLYDKTDTWKHNKEEMWYWCECHPKTPEISWSNRTYGWKFVGHWEYIYPNDKWWKIPNKIPEQDKEIVQFT